MRLSLSTLALPAHDHARFFPALRRLEVEGVEVCPGLAWTGGPGQAAAVTAYGRAAQMAGLDIAALHRPFRARPDLDLFAVLEGRRRTRDHLVALSAVARDLGARLLILDDPRPHALRPREAWGYAREVLEDVLERIEPHGTVLCLAPRPAAGGDFCATAHDNYLMANAIDHGSFGLHLGAAALAANREMGHATFACLRGRLDHVHLDEPGLAAPGDSGMIDHADLRRHLAANAYRGWLSVIHTLLPGADPLERIRRGLAFVSDIYLPLDVR